MPWNIPLQYINHAYVTLDAWIRSDVYGHFALVIVAVAAFIWTLSYPRSSGRNRW